MEIELRTGTLIAEVIITSANTKIKEDLAVVKNNKGIIPTEEIEKLLTVAREMNLFNGKSDVDFVTTVFDAFLSDHEKEQFLSNVEL